MGDSAKTYKAKQFRVAVAGKTVDGREITENQIFEMASSYDVKKYQARIWLEHLRGYAPDSVFGAYGDILAAEAKRDDAGVLGLYVTMAPLETMVNIVNKLKQKIFSSVEIDTNFQGSGKAYLVGLAFTDSPASTGCEVLQFSAQASALRRPTSLFSTPVELDGVVFDEAQASVVDALLAGFSQMFETFKPATPPAAPAPAPAPSASQPAADPHALLFSKVAEIQAAQAQQIGDLKKAVDQLTEQFAKLDNAPAGTPRPPATGSQQGTGYVGGY